MTHGIRWGILATGGIAHSFTEDLVLTGVQKAIAEAKALAESEMGKVTAGLGLPPGLGF